jgi:hypothetical protein
VKINLEVLFKSNNKNKETNIDKRELINLLIKNNKLVF